MGDLVDRGPDSVSTLDFVKGLVRKGKVCPYHSVHQPSTAPLRLDQHLTLPSTAPLMLDQHLTLPSTAPLRLDQHLAMLVCPRDLHYHLHENMLGPQLPSVEVSERKYLK